MGFLGSLAKASIKLGACGGALYYAYTENFFGDANQTIMAFEQTKLKAQAQTYVDMSPVKDARDNVMEMIPKTDIDIQAQKQNLKQGWNNGVHFVFSGALELPALLGQQGQELVKMVAKATNDNSEKPEASK
ncbi:hypothetical protein TCAL_14336 [Tigriopus californicus]|uniref:MICOS complex subunit MIC13 n=1 Tax=Tigriopus californicus TaxID=6832 RepID=A0A553NC17_TIGCA|nr:hypothetical protein TCAL_14336 [Tigriopus californicus]